MAPLRRSPSHGHARCVNTVEPRHRARPGVFVLVGSTKYDVRRLVARVSHSLANFIYSMDVRCFPKSVVPECDCESWFGSQFKSSDRGQREQRRRRGRIDRYTRVG